MLQVNLYVLAFLISTLTAGALAVYAFSRRSGPGRTELGWLMLALAWWSLSSALEAAFILKPIKQAFGAAGYLGSQTTPVLFLLLALRFTRTEASLATWKKSLLFLIPLVSLFMAITNSWHNLLWSSVTLENTTFGGVTIFYGHGPWFWVEIVYAYTLMAAGIVALVRAVATFPRLFSLQSRILLLSALIPWLLSILYALSPASTSGIDLTPIAITWSGFMLTWATAHYRFLDQPSIPHDLMMDNLQEGILLLDPQGRVVDVNLAFRNFFNLDLKIIGQPLDCPLPNCAELHAFVGQSPRESRMEYELAGEPRRCLELILKPFLDSGGNLLGTLLAAHDISARKQAEDALRESETRYRLLVENQAEGIAIVDPQERFTFANPAAERILGVSSGELLGRVLAEFTPPEQFERVDGGQTSTFEVQFTRPDGAARTLEITASPQYDAQGKYVASFSIIRDVTERKQAELAVGARQRYLILLSEITTAALGASDMESMLRTLADRMGALLDADGCYITLWDQKNARAIPMAAHGPMQEAYSGLTLMPGELTMTQSVLQTGHALVVDDVVNSEFISPRIAALFPARSMLALPLIAGGRKLGAALISFNQTHAFTSEEVVLGEQAAAQISLALLKSLLLQEAGLARDQAQDANRQLQRAMAELAQLATTDRLTGAYNRHKLDELTTYEINRSARYRQPLSLIMLDIDHFKDVNDAFGHLAGDQVLINLVGLLQANLRETDSLARWGGEEFLILCPGITGAQALKLAEKIRKVVAGHDFRPVGHMTLSIGAAEIFPGESFDQGILRADEALYKAKNKGRNRAELVT